VIGEETLSSIAEPPSGTAEPLLVRHFGARENGHQSAKRLGLIGCVWGRAEKTGLPGFGSSRKGGNHVLRGAKAALQRRTATHCDSATLQQQFLQSAKVDLISKYPEQAASINKTFDALAKEPMRFDDVFQALLPVYRNHYTISQIQELNNFYSTDIMRSMVKESPLVVQEAAPIVVKLMNDYIARTANIAMQ
jgi:hypothetical protein